MSPMPPIRFNPDLCPVCGNVAVAVGYKTTVDPDTKKLTGAHTGQLWCDTENCPHNVDTGVPWHAEEEE